MPSYVVMYNCAMDARNYRLARDVLSTAVTAAVSGLIGEQEIAELREAAEKRPPVDKENRR